MAHNDDHLARLTSVRTEPEAGIIVGGLEARGIQATMSGVYTTNFRAEAPGWVEVLVAEQDLPQAQAVLEEVRSERSDLDWSQVDVGEPEDDRGSDAVPWWMGLVFWKRVAFVVIVLGLAYEICVIALAMIGRTWAAVP